MPVWALVLNPQVDLSLPATDTPRSLIVSGWLGRPSLGLARSCCCCRDTAISGMRLARLACPTNLYRVRTMFSIQTSQTPHRRRLGAGWVGMGQAEGRRDGTEVVAGVAKVTEVREGGSSSTRIPRLPCPPAFPCRPRVVWLANSSLLLWSHGASKRARGAREPCRWCKRRPVRAVASPPSPSWRSASDCRAWPRLYETLAHDLAAPRPGRSSPSWPTSLGLRGP